LTDKQYQTVEEKAAGLFSAAHIVAISSLGPVLDRFESPRLKVALEKSGTEPWDFFVAAACVFVALDSFSEREDNARTDQLARPAFDVKISGSSAQSLPSNTIEAHMEQFRRTWRHEGERAVEDCANFVHRSVKGVAPGDARAAICLGIGSWVLWNLYGEAPSRDEGSIALAIGNVVAQSFAGYWD
jgi:hypothetical protein